MASELERLQHLLRASYAMCFPNEEYPSEDTEALAVMVAQIQVMREALATVGVVNRGRKES